MPSDEFAIIVAGGRGVRMNTELPKQFLRILDKPVIVHTVSKFISYNADIRIFVALPRDHFGIWQEIKKEFLPTLDVSEVEGGEQRFHSVKNVLSQISSDQGTVAVHDAVRPCVSIQDIARSFELAREKGNGVLTVPLKESIREWISGDLSEARERGRYRLVQTPQTFQLELLKKAYNQDYQSKFTDDASVVESIGVPIHMIDGADQNIKITTPGDLQVAKSFLNQ